MKVTLQFRLIAIALAAMNPDDPDESESDTLTAGDAPPGP
jgi:hypothetical protein